MLSNAWHASCRLPDFEYMSTRTFPTNTSFSNPALTMQAWTLLPLSSTARLAQALRAVLKVTLSGFTPSAKRDYIASFLRPCWSQTEIIAIQEITSLLGSLSNTMSTCSPRHFLKEVSDPNPALKTWIFFPSFRSAHGWLKFSFYDAWVHLCALFQSCSWTSNCMEDTTGSNPLVAWAQISRRPVHHTPAEHIQKSWWSMKPHPVWACCKILGSHQEYSCTWHTCWEGCSIEKQLA